MKKFIASLFLFILSINSANSYELFYPHDKKNINNGNYAFFFGKASKTEVLSVNDESVFVAPNGAFAFTVKLKNGENRIVLKSNFNTQIYKFYKNKVEKTIKPELIEYEPRVYLVKNDNTPLRSTHVDFGMNRVSHLFKDTRILVNGEYDNFYRVYLSKNKEAWIDKNSVVVADDKELISKFITMNSETFKNASIHTIEFTEKLPYTIEEDDKQILFKVYNPEFSENSVYTITVRKPQKYYYSTVSVNGVYQFKVNELPYIENSTLEGLNIVVDAGHGGSERGAVGCLGDAEKDINLSIAQELQNILCQMGANVIMTRECDANISLEDRVAVSKENCANIFVSIHLNSIGDVPMNVHKTRGTSVFYYNPNSKELAESIENELPKSLGTRNDGVKEASFAVIRPTDYVAVLVETAYMTNPLDSILYKSPDFARNAAIGIAHGILNFANSSSK